MVKRRDFIGALAAALTASARASSAQPQRASLYRIGFLGTTSAPEFADRIEAFRAGLRDLGYVEGQNLATTYRWADGHLDRLPQLAGELVAAKADVIIAIGPAVWAAKRATTVIPIVIAFSGDPVGTGVVANLARPGGNITGFSYMSTDLAAKRLELSHMLEAHPLIAILVSVSR